MNGRSPLRGGPVVDKAWHDTLCVIADGSLPAFWRMSNGAAFWWTPDPVELLADRFARQPFLYREIDSITVFAEVRFGGETFTCDLPSLRRRLSGIPGLVASDLADVTCPPVRPPSQAVRLSLSGCDPDQSGC